jgi:twitching motility two-component system response regulator PilG
MVMNNLGVMPSHAHAHSNAHVPKKLLIGAFGLSDYELRLVRSVLSLTMVHGRSYSFALFDTASTGRPDIVIVDPNNDQAKATLQELTSHDKTHEPFVIFISNTPQASQDKYHLLRPLAPTKMLALLDHVASEFANILPSTAAPVVPPAPPALCTSIKPAPVKQLFRALIVDDSPTARIKIEIELRAMNIMADSAQTGEEALKMLTKKTYDLIFLDIILPGADGYEVCKLIRRNQETKRIPVIMLTSKSSPFDRIRGSLAGCNWYLTKPVEHVKFYDVIEKCLVEGKAIFKQTHDKNHGMPMTA